VNDTIIKVIANRITTYYPSSFSVGYWAFSEAQLIEFAKQLIAEENKWRTVDGLQ
jgi:3-methyladenine DNA glycosylase AlkD